MNYSRHSGEPTLQRLRDDAREIAAQLRLPEEFRSLDALIGALLGTRKAALDSPIAIARDAGMPYDPHRMELFQRLFAEVAGTAPVTRLSRPTDGPALPFFEAYFQTLSRAQNSPLMRRRTLCSRDTSRKHGPRMRMTYWAPGE